MSVGERLKKIKNLYRLKNEELAEILGVSKTALNNYFKDVNSPGTDVMSKLLDHLYEVDGNWLVTGQGEMINSKPKANKSSGHKKYKLHESDKPELKEPEEDYNDYKSLLEEKDRRIEELKETIALQNDFIKHLQSKEKKL